MHIDTCILFIRHRLLLTAKSIGMEKIARGRDLFSGNVFVDFKYIICKYNDENAISDKDMSENDAAVYGYDEKEITIKPDSYFIKFVNLSKPQSVWIISMAGVIVLKCNVHNGFMLNVSNLENGRYFIRFENAKTIMFEKD